MTVLPCLRTPGDGCPYGNSSTNVKTEGRCFASALCFIGAGDEARTRYLHLGKVALYRMSYTRGTD